MDKQGKNSINTFLAKTKSRPVNELYSVAAIVKRIKKISSSKTLKVIDIGAHKGELSSGLRINLGIQKVEVTAVENDQNYLRANNDADYKIFADVSKDRLPKRQYDLAIMRYVLHWNNKESQEFILENVLNSTNEGIILLNVGPDEKNSEQWREKTDKIFKTNMFGLKRDKYYFPNSADIKSIIRKNGWSYKSLDKDKKIKKLSEILRVKYGLGKDQKEKIRKILGNCDYLIKTTLWIQKKK